MLSRETEVFAVELVELAMVAELESEDAVLIVLEDGSRHGEANMMGKRYDLLAEARLSRTENGNGHFLKGNSGYLS
jgi:hypothetical protein